MKNLLLVMFLTVMLPGISGCATEATEPMTLEQQLEAQNYFFGEEVKRIGKHRINGWKSVDDRHVIIKAGVSDEFLLVLRNQCTGLRSALGLSFMTTAGSVTASDSLLVKGPGDFTSRCWIDSMYRLQKIDKKASNN